MGMLTAFFTASMHLASAALGQVTRRIWQPAASHRFACATLPAMSSTGTFSMVCTAMGWLPPMVTLPIFTSRFNCRILWFPFLLYSSGDEPDDIVVGCKDHQPEQQRKGRNGQAALQLFRHSMAGDALNGQEHHLAAVQHREGQQV